MTSHSTVPAPSGIYGVAKRAADIIFSLSLLLLLAPLLACIWAAVRVESEGPGFYTQRRIGRWGDEFVMYKFRTMRTDTPELATADLGDAKNHMTRVGRVLRRTSLDELPQLLNILVGEMSFVGPRPALWSQLDLTSMRAARGVLALRPGLTGLAQVCGRDELDLGSKVHLDETYLQEVRLSTDIRIVVQTLGAAVTGRGAK